MKTLAQRGQKAVHLTKQAATPAKGFHEIRSATLGCTRYEIRPRADKNMVSI
jgi:hypothetical protein